MGTRDPIKKVVLASGEVRWRFVVDVAKPGEPRRQRRHTFHTRREAQAVYGRIRGVVADGSHVDRNRVTVAGHIAEWLTKREAEGEDEIREVTLIGYRSALAHAVRAFGDVRLQELTRGRVIGMVATMRDAGLSGRTIGLTLTLLRAVLRDAVAEGLVVRNVADGVSAPRHRAAGRSAFTAPEVGVLADAARGDRLYPAWLLTLTGLRRSEVLGLRWSDIDIEAGTVRIVRGRVNLEHGRTRVGAPKTAAGARTLRLAGDVELITALRALRARQAAERLALGSAYNPDGYVAVDEAGTPIRPEAYSDAWRALTARAGVRPLTLHEARHTAVTLLRAARDAQGNSIGDHEVAAMMGHDEVVMRRVYSHPSADGQTAAGAALAGIRGTM